MTFGNNNYSLDPESNYDYLKQKWKKNDEEILKTKNSGIDDKDVQQSVGYLDCRNYKLHQVVFGDNVMDVNKNPRKIITSEKELQIKSYRKDQIINAVTP